MLILAVVPGLAAALVMPQWFRDGMVLQTNLESGDRAFLNGWGEPGEEVFITTRKKNYTTTVSQNGSFRVMLDPRLVTPDDGAITVTSDRDSQRFVAANVAYGDVFLCSGGPEMLAKLGSREPEELRNPNFSNFRFFATPVSVANVSLPTTPNNDKESKCPLGDNSLCLRWITAQEAVSTPVLANFSSMCYLTAVELQRLHNANRPVGLVLSAADGLGISSWVPPGAGSACHEGSPEDKSHGVHWNAMVNPFRYMTVRAVLWYQGLADKGATAGYESCWLRALVSSWRDQKETGDFAFIALQLPWLPLSSASDYEGIRIGQGTILPKYKHLDITGLAVSLDLPKSDVQTMAFRLALAAAHTAYGIPGSMNNSAAGPPRNPASSYWTGPVPLTPYVAEAAVLIPLDPQSSRNATFNAPATCASKACCSKDARSPFDLLNTKGEWVQVRMGAVTLLGGLITVQADGVNLVKVRYAGGGEPTCLVVNGDGLPMGPFEVELGVAAPPMGVNTWNYYHCNIDEEEVKALARSLVQTGMTEAGYQYVNIDDCWQASRAPDGTIVPDAARFPSGMKALADYVHSLGLKFGLYTSSTSLTCQSRPGSYGHESLDAKTYCDWGVDYLKIDHCRGDSWPAVNKSWELFQAGFKKCFEDTGRQVVESVEYCRDPTGCGSWIKDVATMWRTTGDIQANWDSVLSNIRGNNAMARVAAPGHFNDADILNVGNPGLTPTEQVSHMSLWCLASSPLLAGTNIETASKETLQILTNPEAIAVNQDLGVDGAIQGTFVANITNGELWAKSLSTGDAAVILLNVHTTALNLTAEWTLLGYPRNTALAVRDLWAHADLGPYTDSFTHTVSPHGVAFLKLTPHPNVPMPP